MKIIETEGGSVLCDGLPKVQRGYMYECQHCGNEYFRESVEKGIHLCQPCLNEETGVNR
jgi:ribosomal protein L37AE/L43A